MISAFCRSGLLEEAKELVCQVEAKYKSYDVIMLNTMLCAYCRVGEMENVMKMLKRMDELAITPDWNTFHILIKYFCKEKIYMLAYQTLEDMHRKGHQPEEVLYSFRNIINFPCYQYHVFIIIFCMHIIMNIPVVKVNCYILKKQVQLILSYSVLH